MKRFIKQSLGVTLLEILLVLAIAAMIIVMSIRYYQAASSSQQVNMVMEEIQNITATMDNLQIGSGSYSNVTSAQLLAVVGSANLTSPTGQAITVTPASPTTYTVSIPVNLEICTSVAAKLVSNTKITGIQTCGTTVQYTYDNTK